MIFDTTARPPIDDLDALPLPARDLIDVERYLDHWETTAGYRLDVDRALFGASRQR